MKSLLVDVVGVVLNGSKSFGKLFEVNGDNVWLKSVNGWRKRFWGLLPDVNGSNALERRLLDEIDDDVDEADDEGREEKWDGRIDDACWNDWDDGKSGNLLFIVEVKCCWSTNSVIQFEQSLDKGFVNELVAITIGISFRHDEQTPPVLLLFILLISLIISKYSIQFRSHLQRPHELIGHDENEIQRNMLKTCFLSLWCVCSRSCLNSRSMMEPDNNLKQSKKKKERNRQF